MDFNSENLKISSTLSKEDRTYLYPADKAIHRLFEEQVERTPDHIAVVELGHGARSVVVYDNTSAPGRDAHLRTEDREIGNRDEVSLTYQHLNDITNQLAHHLYEQGIKSHELLGIMVERSIEMIIGMLGILKAGCAYVPLNPTAGGERNGYILKECNIEMLLSSRQLFEETAGGEIEDDRKVGSWKGKTIFIEDIGVRQQVSGTRIAAGLTPAQVSTLSNDGQQQVLPRRFLQSATGCFQPTAALAYVIFTSGSTGKPKGVPITHANLSPLLHWGYRHLGLATSDRTLQNLAYYFDWSVWEIFITLTSGAILYIVDDEVLLSPETCTAFIEQHGITFLHATPSQYRHLLSAERRMETLKFLFIGAEKFTVDLLERVYSSVNKDCRIFNMYGPTEATIISAVLEIDRLSGNGFQELSSIPIGQAVGNGDLLVLDENLKPCPVNIPGELFIGGEGLSRGYLNSPEMTLEKFISVPTYTSAPRLTERLYRTGDQVRWLLDGNIEFLERIDQQVKIRGFRIELGEIESQILKYPSIKEAIVTVRETEKREKYLCAYIVAGSREQGTAGRELREYLSRDLPDYMIPTYFICLDNIPLNANGKIDRKALPEPDFVDTRERYLVPRDETEKKLAAIWSEILGISEHLIGIDDNFFELGGHSLNASRLTARILQAFNVRIPLTEIFRIPFIRKLSTHLKNIEKDEFVPPTAAEKKEYYALSPSQKRFYFIHELASQSTGYNIYDAYVLEGKVDEEKMERTFSELIHRHEGLRTSFVTVNKDPVQKIHDQVAFKIELFNMAQGSWHMEPGEECRELDTLIKNFIRPFDLSQPPLFRVGLVKLEEEKHLFLFDMHHIIGDAVSIEIFVKEVMTIYAEEKEKLPELQLQYKDFSEWQRDWMMSGEMRRQETYWLNEFSREISALDIPTDYKRPAVQSFAGDNITFEISPHETMKLKEYAREEDTTMFIVVLALFYVFLFKLSGQKDVVVGTPVAGRRYSELFNIIGIFINTLALRNYLEGDESFALFLKEVKAKTLEAFENQEYPFEELVQKVWTNKDKLRNPIFDVLYTFNRGKSEAFWTAKENTRDTKPFLNLQKYTQHYQHRQSIMDIVLSVTETEDEQQLVFNFGYSTKLFTRETTERFAGYFKEIIAAVVECKSIQLKEIKISHDLCTAKSDISQITFRF